MGEEENEKKIDVGIYVALIEEFFKKVGLDPQSSRLEGMEKNVVGWSLRRGSAQIYLYLLDYEKNSALRIVSPILLLPEGMLLPFYRRCLELNFGLQNCAFAVSKETMFLVTERPMDQLDSAEIENCIGVISWAADTYDDELAKEFGARLCSER